VLSLFISVLRGAVEANAGAAAGSCSDGSGSSKEGSSIPLKGVTKKDWLQVAAFWYPSVPSPQIKGWFQAEKLLSFGIRFDIQLVLHKVSHRHMLTHLVDAEQPVNILFVLHNVFVSSNTDIVLAVRSVWHLAQCQTTRQPDSTAVAICAAAFNAG
jgi:hypothetical protein